MPIPILFSYISILIYASYTDIKYLIIKDRVHIFIIVLSIISIQVNLIEAVMITIPFLIIAVVTDKMGGGDVKFVFANTMLVGFYISYISLLIGFTTALISIIVQARKKKINNKTPFALAPYLSVGYITGYIIQRFMN